MGVASELGYEHGGANPAQRGVQRVAATRPGAWVLARLLPPLDRVIHRTSGGRTSAPKLLTGLSVLMVTTTGRRSGRQRVTALIAAPVGSDDLALLGTRFGQPGTPGWVHNLEGDPNLVLEYRGRTCRAMARPATGEQLEQIWTSAGSLYPGYASYRDRVTDRSIRVFVLEPAE
jgi:deazaflavin-dependent oxidoreductase (nitroreductase family)